jgi:hypothetical protein
MHMIKVLACHAVPFVFKRRAISHRERYSLSGIGRSNNEAGLQEWMSKTIVYNFRSMGAQLTRSVLLRVTEVDRALFRLPTSLSRGRHSAQGLINALQRFMRFSG